jgi:hypothetical protein
MMRGDKANQVLTTYQTDAFPNHLMWLTDAEEGWRNGFEARLGRRFGACGEWAVEADYWRIDSLDASASASVDGGTVSTPFLVGDIEFGGVNGSVLFNGASVHRIQRHDEFENFEFNLIHAPLVLGGGCCPLEVQWLAGFRWFRFDERLVFESENPNGQTAFLGDRIYNYLYGGQVGLDAGVRLGCRVRVFAAVKLGLYENHIQNTFDAQSGDGVHANPIAGSGVAGAFPVSAAEDRLAALAQWDAGVQCQICPYLYAFAGYRLLAVTGLGLADHQFLTRTVNIPEYQTIKSNGELFLHGAYAGVQVQF